MMAIPPSGPANLVLEQWRAMRAESNARFDRIDAEIGNIKVEVADIKEDVRGLELNTIAGIYKANLSVASFADHERRIESLERKLLSGRVGACGGGDAGDSSCPDPILTHAGCSSPLQ